MTILTKSMFFTSEPVILTNRFLDFDETGPALLAELDSGARSPTDLLIEVARAMNTAGALTYIVSFDRTLNRVTISTTSTFSLLIATGSNATQSIFSNLGFTGGDLTGSSSYTGNLDFVTVYRPQMILQDFIPFEHWEESVQATVNEAGGGITETVSFGDRNFMQLNIKFISVNWLDAPEFDNDAAALTNVLTFMKFIRKKSPLEFIPNRDDANTFDKILLEKSPQSSKGIGFKLKELTGRKMRDYFETGKLIFRRQT